MDRWVNGIYNLDRLCIIIDEHFFSTSEADEFHGIVENIKARKFPKTLQNNEVIALDASKWRLKIETHGIQVDYKWETASEDNVIFAPLIELIAHQHSIKI